MGAQWQVTVITRGRGLEGPNLITCVPDPAVVGGTQVGRQRQAPGHKAHPLVQETVRQPGGKEVVRRARRAEPLW